MWPAFMLGLFLSVCSLALTDQVIPWAVGNIQRVVSQAMEEIFLDILRTNYQLVDRDKGISITVMGVEDKKLIVPTFRYATSPGKAPVTVQAEEATLDFDLENNQVIVHLVRGHLDIPGRGKSYFVKIDKSFPLPIENLEIKPRHLSMLQIRNELQRMQQNGDVNKQKRDIEVAMLLLQGRYERFSEKSFRNEYRPRNIFDWKRADRLQAELHSRVALSCSCFFFVIVGCPFSIMQARQQFLTNFLLCFVPILVVYYPVVLLMVSLSKSGSVSGPAPMWLGNVILLIAGAVIVRKVLKH